MLKTESSEPVGIIVQLNAIPKFYMRLSSADSVANDSLATVVTLVPRLAASSAVVVKSPS